MELRIGSRGSQLALWQANHIAGLLRGAGHAVEIEIIRTTGDKLQEIAFSAVGAKGMFTKEIEEALAEGRIDLAVHSLKDLPTELPEAFVVAATPKRVDPRDVLVSVEPTKLSELPAGARVGTSSQRRRAQLKATRPDLEPIEFRGNVDTRLRKLAEGQVSAVLLAAAGLDRLGRTDWIRERMNPENFCPAAGQGALGIETRQDDAQTRAALAVLNHEETQFAVTAERTALMALGGGCQVPIGVYCRAEASGWEIFGVVASPDSGKAIRVRHSVEADACDATTLGRQVAEMLLQAGAGELLASQPGAKI